MQNKDIPIMILAGGRGTRLMEETREIPKPMVTIGGKPILLHLMQYYSRFGFRKFIVCLGYKGELIKEYFMNVRERTSTVRLHAGGKVEYEIGPAGEGELRLAGQSRLEAVDRDPARPRRDLGRNIGDEPTGEGRRIEAHRQPRRSR